MTTTPEERLENVVLSLADLILIDLEDENIAGAKDKVRAFRKIIEAQREARA